MVLVRLSTLALSLVLFRSQVSRGSRVDYENKSVAPKSTRRTRSRGEKSKKESKRDLPELPLSLTFWSVDYTGKEPPEENCSAEFFTDGPYKKIAKKYKFCHP